MAKCFTSCLRGPAVGPFVYPQPIYYDVCVFRARLTRRTPLAMAGCGMSWARRVPVRNATITAPLPRTRTSRITRHPMTTTRTVIRTPPLPMPPLLVDDRLYLGLFVTNTRMSIPKPQGDNHRQHHHKHRKKKKSLLCWSC